MKEVEYNDNLIYDNKDLKKKLNDAVKKQSGDMDDVWLGINLEGFATTSVPQGFSNEELQNKNFSYTEDDRKLIFDVADAFGKDVSKKHYGNSQFEKNKKEREYFESLTPEQKIEYNRIKKRNKNLKRLGMYGLTAAGMVTGVGIPVMMAANAGAILSDDSLTFSKEKHDEKLKKSTRRKGQVNPKNTSKQKAKPRQYFTISYDNNGYPEVNTLVDFDPYLLQFRYEELIRDE